MKIITLTLNPAYDVHVKIKDFLIGKENLAASVLRNVGGKGINLSRALNAGGTENRALVLLGEENSADFCAGLADAKVDYCALYVKGRIRENITVHTDAGTETRLSFRGFACEPGIMDLLKEKSDVAQNDIVTFTGSLPDGISAETAEEYLLWLREKGARLVIDSKSISRQALKNLRPWLIKPNAEEISAYFGEELSGDGLIKAARTLHSEGTESVMITSGADGAVLCGGEALFCARVPEIKTVSTIGAGDSTIAGFIAASVRGENAESALRTAVSYGAAACLLEGTQPPRMPDAEYIAKKVTVQRISD